MMSADPRPAGAAPSAPLVTVIMACYRAAADLPEALDSVLAQTMADLEVLVLDDGSPDQVVPEGITDDPRVIVERFPVNRGYAAMTNEGIRRARGTWVTFVDSDDSVPPDYLETLLAAAEETGADTVFAPVMCVRNGVEIGTQWWSPPGRVADARTAMRCLLRNEIVGNQQVLMRRPTVESPEGQPYSDYVFQLRNLASRDLAAYVDRPMYRYTIRTGSVSGGLHESVWKMREVPALVRPVVEEVFDAAEVEVLIRDNERHTITQMLHKASRERRDTALRREVTEYCRRQVTIAGALALIRHGFRTEGMSWILLWISPRLHRFAYRIYDRRKGGAHG